MAEAFAAIMLCARAVGAAGVECDRLLTPFLTLTVRGTEQQARALRAELWQAGSMGRLFVDVTARECGP